MSNAEMNALPASGVATIRASGAAKQRRLVLLVAVPAFAICVSAVVYLLGGRYVETDNAYVKADKIPVSAEVSGTISKVLVRENQTVNAGDVLFSLDPAPFDVEVAKAEARLAQARADIAALKASYREKQTEIRLARTRAAFARADRRRQTELVAMHFISASKLDQARENADIAAQQAVVLEQDLRRIAENLGGSVDLPIERHPNYLMALAELKQAQLDRQRVDVRAPMAGTVSKPPKVGQYVGAGATALALVVSGDLWVEANFPETDLTYVHPGQPVSISVDTYPDTKWRGMVDSLSPATGAEFSLIPAQNATGNWVKISQRVPVRIKLKQKPGEPQLRAGLSAIVEIDTGHRRRLLGFSL